MAEKFSGVLSWISGKNRLTEENLTEAYNRVRDALLEADVPHSIVESFLDQVKQDVVSKKVQSALKPGEQLIKVVHDRLLEFLGGKNAVTAINFTIPSVIMVMGLQGSGKTTTVAKLCHYIKEQARQRGKQRHILVGSVDYYRPAAIDQLEKIGRASCRERVCQ